MANNNNVETNFKAGISVDGKLRVPAVAADPGSPVGGWVWFNTTDKLFKYFDGTTVIPLAASAGLDTEGVQDIVGAMVSGNTETGLTVSYDDPSGKLNFVVVDSPTVGGYTPSQLQTAIIAAIVDGSPAALDTLNELANALGGDANFATTITNQIAARAKGFEKTLDGGAATEVVTHNLGTRAVVCSVYKNSGTYDEDQTFLFRHTTVNTITVVSEAGNIPTGYNVVVLAKGA